MSKIRFSVGQGEVNHPEDVRTIQQFLNKIPQFAGGPKSKLHESGVYSAETNAALANFLETLGRDKYQGLGTGRRDYKPIQFGPSATPPPGPRTIVRSLNELHRLKRGQKVFLTPDEYERVAICHFMP